MLIFSCSPGYKTKPFAGSGGTVNQNQTNNFPVSTSINGEVKETKNVQLNTFTHSTANAIRISPLSPGGKEVLLVNAAGGANTRKECNNS